MSAIVAAVATGVAGVAAAGASIYGANKQASAAQNAQNIQQQQYQNTVNLENPYNQSGVAAQNQLNYLLGDGGPTAGASTTQGAQGSLNAPFTTQMFQQYSPAYQFQLQQGMQGVLNGSASNQGALSGAALTGLTQYNQASANTAFNNAFNQYQTQQSNIYQRLANTAQLGQAAASGTAQAGTSLANGAAQSAQNVGTAYANGANGAASALGGAASTAGLYAAYGGGGGTSTAGGGSNFGVSGNTFTDDTGP